MAQATFNLVGKVALITGAAGGIGRAAAIQFAASGASVVLGDLDEVHGAELCAHIEGVGARAVFLRTDVSRPADCEALVDAACSRFGSLDFAFNNAGIFGRPALLQESGVADWERVIGVNLGGIFNCLRSELSVMQDGACIVNNASVIGLLGGYGAAAYSASKHGVIGLTRSAALEQARRGVRVNAICPGFVATPMTSSGGDFNDKWVASAVRRTAMGRMAQPDEIAAAVLWLCSDGASYVTGAALAIDGGFTAG